jgi:hypothetical protein
VKRKSLDRLQSELRTKLQPQVDPRVLETEVQELLKKFLGDSPRNVNLAANLAAYLTQKYWISDRKAGRLRQLIQNHPNELTTFIDEMFSQDLDAFFKAGLFPRANKQTQPKPRTKAELAQRRKISKRRYDSRRREYRDGLIEIQFGTLPACFDPRLSAPPEGPCLDVLFRGGAIRMAGHRDSLENLFGEDRHRFPKSLLHERNGRTKVYYLDAFLECLIHLLTNKDGHKQWLPLPIQRELVVRGIIERAHGISSEIGDLVEEKLRPYLP